MLKYVRLLLCLKEGMSRFLKTIQSIYTTISRLFIMKLPTHSLKEAQICKIASLLKRSNVSFSQNNSINLTICLIFIMKLPTHSLKEAQICKVAYLLLQKNSSVSQNNSIN